MATTTQEFMRAIQKKGFKSETEKERYANAFYFYFSKPINDVINEEATPFNYIFEETKIWDDKTEIMRRYYTIPETEVRLKNYTTSYKEIYPFYTPNICIVKPFNVILRKMHRMHRYYMREEEDKKHQSLDGERAEENEGGRSSRKKFQPMLPRLLRAQRLLSIQDLTDGMIKDVRMSFGESEELSDDDLNLTYETKLHDIYNPEFSSCGKRSQRYAGERRVLDYAEDDSQKEFVSEMQVEPDYPEIQGSGSEKNGHIRISDFSELNSPKIVKRKVDDKKFADRKDTVEKFERDISENLRLQRGGDKEKKLGNIEKKLGAIEEFEEKRTLNKKRQKSNKRGAKLPEDEERPTLINQEGKNLIDIVVKQQKMRTSKSTKKRMKNMRKRGRKILGKKEGDEIRFKNSKIKRSLEERNVSKELTQRGKEKKSQKRLNTRHNTSKTRKRDKKDSSKRSVENTKVINKKTPLVNKSDPRKRDTLQKPTQQSKSPKMRPRPVRDVATKEKLSHGNSKEHKAFYKKFKKDISVNKSTRKSAQEGGQVQFHSKSKAKFVKTCSTPPKNIRGKKKKGNSGLDKKKKQLKNTISERYLYNVSQDRKRKRDKEIILRSFNLEKSNKNSRIYKSIKLSSSVNMSKKIKKLVQSQKNLDKFKERFRSRKMAESVNKTCKSGFRSYLDKNSNLRQFKTANSVLRTPGSKTNRSFKNSKKSKNSRKNYFQMKNGDSGYFKFLSSKIPATTNSSTYKQIMSTNKYVHRPKHPRDGKRRKEKSSKSRILEKLRLKEKMKMKELGGIICNMHLSGGSIVNMYHHNLKKFSQKNSKNSKIFASKFRKSKTQRSMNKSERSNKSGVSKKKSLDFSKKKRSLNKKTSRRSTSRGKKKTKDRKLEVLVKRLLKSGGGLGGENIHHLTDRYAQFIDTDNKKKPDCQEHK